MFLGANSILKLIMNDKMASRVCPNFLVCHGQGNSNPNSQGLRHYVIDNCPSNQSIVFLT
jgi:hypothetical protein